METSPQMKKKGFFKCSKLLPKSFSSVTKQPKKSVSNLSSSMQEPVSYFSKSPSFYDHKCYADKTWGRGDDNVDSMATDFISTVRRRFELNGVVDSTGENY